jgi:hypothetical protein
MGRKKRYAPGCAEFTANFVGPSFGADRVRETRKAFEELGADELIFNATVPDLGQIARLAEVVR